MNRIDPNSRDSVEPEVTPKSQLARKPKRSLPACPSATLWKMFAYSLVLGGTTGVYATHVYEWYAFHLAGYVIFVVISVTTVARYIRRPCSVKQNAQSHADAMSPFDGTASRMSTDVVPTCDDANTTLSRQTAELRRQRNESQENVVRCDADRRI